MRFRALAEVDLPAYDALTKVRRTVEPLLNSSLSQSSLAELDILLRYVPIVMPVSAKDGYPERSAADYAKKIYDCSPQLNFEVFVSGTFGDQLQEYINGIAVAGPHLSQLGVSAEHISEFENILKEVTSDILSEHGT